MVSGYSLGPRGFHGEANDIRVAVLPSLPPSLPLSSADSGGPGSRAKSRVPPEVICETITHLLKEEGGTIRSRDLGRALHKTPILDNGTTVLAVIKEASVRGLNSASKQDVLTKNG